MGLSSVLTSSGIDGTEFRPVLYKSTRGGILENFLKAFGRLFLRSHDDPFAMIPLWTLWRYALLKKHLRVVYVYMSIRIANFFPLNLILSVCLLTKFSFGHSLIKISFSPCLKSHFQLCQ